MREKYSEVRTPYDGIRFYSALTHGIGIPLALSALFFLLYLTITAGDSLGTIAAVSVYAVSMLMLYTASTLYHSLTVGVRGRLFLRKLDHVMVYLLIAGTYTPVCAISLWNGLSGRLMLTVIWVMAILGSAFTLFWIRMPRALTAAIYIIMGWVAIFAIYPLYHVLTHVEFAFLLSGGIAYTIGGVLYALKWPGRNNEKFGCHEIFHCFIVLGSILHFVLVYQIIR